jgi:3-methyladenine DNA glycosylase AlkD
MQAYMKSALPFHGIPTPLRRQLCRQVLRAHPMADSGQLVATARELFRSATHREQWYAACELPGGERTLARAAGLQLLPLFEELLRRSAWWDCCDEISAHGLPPLLREHPAEMKPLLRQWARGDDLWLRRAAFLCQRGRRKPDFDAVLFYDCILPSIGDSPLAREFFIRKGLGWALRERAYDAPDEVRAFCAEYAAALSPLTLREALRVVGARASGGGS